MCGIDDSLSVFVVDDDDAVRDSLIALLEPEGFVVTSFASADEFLNAVGKPRLTNGGRCCLLLDLHMPGQGGQELLDRLNQENLNLPVVVMTGNADDKTRRRALESGAADFLEKPVDAEHLINVLLAAFDGHDGQRQRT